MERPFTSVGYKWTTALEGEVKTGKEGKVPRLDKQTMFWPESMRIIALPISNPVMIFMILFLHSTLGWASIRDVQSGLVKPEQVKLS